MNNKPIPQYLRAINAEQAEQFRAQTAAGDYDLDQSEKSWRDRNEVLEDHGYQLRTRLRPGWTPSWQGTDVNPAYCEDSLANCTRKVVDAVRKSDGREVAIMNLPKQSREREILRHLEGAQLAIGKDHHIAPLLDSFEDDREPHLEFFVMSLLRSYYLLPFEAVSEVLDLFKQLLEGLAFMHSVGVAHRDCSIGNIMMDAPSVFPNGYHPCDITKDRGGFNTIKFIPRYKAPGPVNYYFIDFGISRLYEEGQHHLVIGDDGADRDVPEMTDIDFYDPFPADVFILGNIFKKHFLPEFKNLSFLSSLVDAMTAKEPTERPTAEGALKRLKFIMSSQSYFTLRHRLVGKDEVKSPTSIAYENLGILVSISLVPIKFTIEIPARTTTAVRRFITSKYEFLSKKMS